MVQDLRLKGAIILLGTVTVFFIFIYVIRFFFLKEGFEGQKQFTEAQGKFVAETVFVPMGMSQITDQEAPVQKVIREAAAIGQDAISKLNIGGTDTINYSSILNTQRNKYNEDPITSTAYKVYKTVKFPKPRFSFPTMKDDQKFMNEEVIPAIKLCIKKLHKAMPSYPFSVRAMDILKEDIKTKKPTMDECKKVFKCSNVESIPANI